MSRKTLALFAIAALWTATAFSEAKVKTIIDGLDNPCGVAVQPDTGHIFVADSGAGRVFRMVDGKAQDVIVGFKTDIYGKGPMYNIGPLGLLFLNKDTLIVGGGDLPDGQEQIRSFTIPAVGQAAIKVDQATSGLNLPAEGEIKGEGNFYALAASGDSVFATSNGDDTKGWVARATVKGGKLGAFERFIATKEAVQVDAPVGATIGPRGELVIGQMGEINVPHDSLLTFYNAKDGKMLMNLQTGLYDITALAYSPKGQQLLALDFAWMKPDDGGLYSLVSVKNGGKEGIQAKKVIALDKPTAMAFAADGSLYVTIFGTAAEGSMKKSGSLVKIELGN
jgi:hypothetical protein